MRRALLLACLTLGPAVAATPGRMSEPPRSSFSTVTTMQQARPTLDLLVTVRLLAGLLERGTLAPGAQARAELAAALGELSTRPTLGPLAADRTLDRVRGALTGTQRGTLDAARADLERRADLNLSRARFAAPDGPVNVALLRYGFMLPGGFALARQVAADPELNPYARGGASAATLERLLALLRGP
ncbi:hypothetical protein DAETH_11020 [Deinococcus aetherius]|uniref:Uncharacterized protein n=1 Tax=Deinococcus aetherius TaxID=200252 RepID=A0ABM8ABJ2_9DEIO|nr:hypothetical protein [Deinococcus aetherius]BDP41133.1 hypothetical protein DAETH_11020 [Deinococcus aetherius]